MVLSEAFKKVIVKENLSSDEAEAAMNDIMTAQCTPAQVGAFLTALRMKGETIEEITGCALAMKGNAIPFELKEEDYAIDTCGTGGDGGKTFNVSSAAAIVAAAAGVKVTKHGNRAVSSKSGSADVLAQLNINIELDNEDSKKCFESTGMTFLFAQKYHTAMKNVGPIRKDLGVRTIFNILGPLTNPANIKGQVLGVFDAELTNPIAKVLMKLGRERAMVVHGEDGLDEITTTALTKVSEIRNGEIIDYFINPEDYGIKLSKLEDIEGGDSKENAEIIKRILKGEKGPKRDIVVLNSAAALYVGKIVDSLKDGIKAAEEVIDSGKAYEKLVQLAENSKRG